MFKKRTESYTIKEFLNRGKETLVPVSEFELRKAKEMGLLAGFTLPILLVPLNKTFANTISGNYFGNDVTEVGSQVVEVASQADMYTKMIHAFDPLINLVQALAYPVCMVVVLGGALFIMIGNKEKGFAMMQGAGLGYVLVQMTPIILKILVDAMKSVV